jgi:type I restriction enzyme R subunit
VHGALGAFARVVTFKTDPTEQGVMEPAHLYDSPFTDITPRGSESLFQAAEMEELLRALEAVRTSAVAA